MILNPTPSGKRKPPVPNGKVEAKNQIQMLLTSCVVLTYCYLVIMGKASVEGFVVLATYVIKKFLDLIEKNNGG